MNWNWDLWLFETYCVNFGVSLLHSAIFFWKIYILILSSPIMPRSKPLLIKWVAFPLCIFVNKITFQKKKKNGLHNCYHFWSHHVDFWAFSLVFQHSSSSFGGLYYCCISCLGFCTFLSIVFFSVLAESRAISIRTGHLLQGVVKSIDKTRKVVYLTSDPDTVSKCVVCLLSLIVYFACCL